MSEQATIIIQPVHEWLQRQVANKTVAISDGKSYPCDANGAAQVPADSGMDQHPDWKVVFGSPQPRPVELAADYVPPPDAFRWVQARHPWLFGKTSTGPAPLAWQATFDARGKAAVPSNSAFGDHPDYEWGEYLTEEEAAQIVDGAKLAQPFRAPAVNWQQRDAEEAAALAARAAGVQSGTGSIGDPRKMVDPNSTRIIPGQVIATPDPALSQEVGAAPLAPPATVTETPEELEARLRSQIVPPVFEGSFPNADGTVTRVVAPSAEERDAQVAAGRAKMEAAASVAAPQTPKAPQEASEAATTAPAEAKAGDTPPSAGEPAGKLTVRQQREQKRAARETAKKAAGG